MRRSGAVLLAASQAVPHLPGGPPPSRAVCFRPLQAFVRGQHLVLIDFVLTLVLYLGGKKEQEQTDKAVAQTVSLKSLAGWKLCDFLKRLGSCLLMYLLGRLLPAPIADCKF